MKTTPDLSPREQRIQEARRLQQQGMAPARIAQTLGVQERTVHQYLASRRNTPVPEDSAIYGLVIYQNQEYVAALIQQLFAIGLPVEEFADTLNFASKQKNTDGSGNLRAKTEIGVPWLSNSIGAEGGVGVTHSGANEDRAERQERRQFVYTQANYLHNVRGALDEQGLIVRVDSDDDIRGLSPGTFVDFSATFVPNEVNSILDLTTPELVSAITKYLHKKEALETFDFDSDHETRQAYAQRMEIEANAKAELASAATHAVRQDFRNESTREYFGSITGTGITAVTICDTEYFVNEDKDRILDGSFRVLGKVGEIVESELSILSRNKVLSRLQQPLVDELVERMEEAGHQGQVDMRLNLNLQPPIVKVIPVAIYL